MKRSDNSRFGGLASGLDDDLARDVAPVDGDQAGHGVAFVSVALSRVSSFRNRARPAEPGEAALVGEPEPLGRRLRLGRRLGIVDLREMDDAAVAAEIVVAQLGKAVEAEPLEDERVEMAGEEVGQIEGAELLLGERREDLLAGVEGIAMRAGDASHPFFGEDAVELAAGAAVAVEAQDFVVLERDERGSSPASPRGFARGDCGGSRAGRSGRPSRA